MKKSSLTEDKAEQTPTGGVLVGKRQGQTIIHNKGTLSGYLVGKTHAEGGIKAINKSTGQPLEMQGGEVVITAPAVSDNTKNEFNGKMMTNREILSTINEKGGGVSFAKGGDIPKNIKRTGASYKYGGKTMTDHEIYKHITGGHLAEGMTLSQIAKKHKVSVKELQKQVDMGMKAESEHTSSKREQMKIVKDHLFENPKYYTLLKRAGLKHGGAVRRGSLVRDAKSGNTPARDLNNYNDMLDVEADGQVGGDTGLFARGGKVKTYDDGGSVKELVEYITIGNQSSNPFMDIEKVRFYNFNDFKDFVGGLYKTTGATNKREVFLCINRDDSSARFGVSVSQGKNTNSNFNPFTGTFKDLEKNLVKHYPSSFQDFDFNRWSGVKTATTTASQTSVPTSKVLTKDELYDSKIWIGDDLDLRDKVMAKLIEIGIPEDAQYSNKSYTKDLYIKIYGSDFVLWSEVKSYFDSDDRKEIFPSDLGINVGATPTANAILPDADSVIAIEVLKFVGSGKHTHIAIADNVYDLLSILIKAQEDKISQFYLKYVYNDNSIFQAEYVYWIENSPNTKSDIDPYHTSPSELKEWLRKQTDLNSKPFNLDYFFSKNTNVSTSTTNATATATTIGIYNASEIKLFQVIDEIIERNNFDPLENPILGWRRAGKYNDFTLVDDETGEVFNLRSYNETLGVREEDTSKDRAKGLLKIYINWKATQPSATATATSLPIDLSNTKIWIGDNPALSEKIQKKAFELGWTLFGLKDVNRTDEPALYFDAQNKIGWFDDRKDFDNYPNFKEITEADLFGTVTPTSVPFDLTETKIWIGQDEALSEKIQKRAFELGWFWDNRTPNKPSHTEGTYLSFWTNKTIGWSDVDKLGFNQMVFKEIFESDLFGTTQSQTSTQNAPVEDEDWVKKFTADLDKLSTYLPNDMDFAPELSKERKDLNALIQLLPSFQQSKYAIERAKILKEIKKLHNKLTYEGFIKPNEALSSDADLFTPQGLLDYYFTQATQNPTAELEPACELITPNGEKSKLPMSAYLNVRTEQFKNWFGDWEKAYETGNYVNCSKMIDPDTKEPKIYFHGVRKYVPNFGQFSNMGQGVVRPYGAFEPPSFPASYFAGDEDYAKFYGGVAENLPTPSADYKPFIYKVFLSVKNPISLLPLDFMLSYKDFMDYIYVGYGVKVEPNQELLKVLNNDLTKKNPMWIYVRRDIGFIEKLKDYGYDAIFQMGDIPTFLPNGEVEPDRTKHLQEVEYLTFYPNQVKSATVKKSFYFDFFNDIRFKNGGYVRI